MSKFTLTIDDPKGLLSKETKDLLLLDAEYVIRSIDRYIDWKGTLDVAVQIRPSSGLTWSDADGLLPSITQLSWDGKTFTNDTITECITGVDNQPDEPDVGCTIYLGKDGTIRNYGDPVWLDPNPQFDKAPNIPSGHHDFVSIFTHEVFHGLGFVQGTSQWDQLVSKIGKDYFFIGEQASDLIGGPIILAPDIRDHYGNTYSDQNNIPRGLMFQWGNYYDNRIDIGRVDLAVLSDLGYDVHTYDGLPLFELPDDAPNLTGTSVSEKIYGDYHSNILRGLGGSDHIFGAVGNDKINGDKGNDTLHGGVGRDVLSGGAGLDEFVFDTTPSKRNADLILDFRTGVDKIILDAEQFDLVQIGSVSGVPLLSEYFIIGQSAKDSDDHLIYDESSGKLYFDADGLGGIDQVLIATLGAKSHPYLAASDFLIVA